MAVMLDPVTFSSDKGGGRTAGGRDLVEKASGHAAGPLPVHGPERETDVVPTQIAQAAERLHGAVGPDVAGEKNLSGDLSHKYPLPANAKFIGLLSRFYSEKNISTKKIVVVNFFSG